MHKHRSFRLLSVVLFLVLLVAPWAAEAQPATTPRADTISSPAILDYFVDWLMALWGNEGCTMDPSGGCHEKLDEVCGWDPNGGCHDNG